ncbi:toprim domain-containing protein [Listeria fleischmannii]|uniref:toprim domain-containing protein n=1 Tax=Listeria fleischmannii TaxID=1069827 RepID=UPI001625DAE9|nr:toprim domain-containing protein [Listeria fleischmannii]MBC1419892.1 toprim domain-containing protein [Listeria fleischmannii]
MNKNVQEYTDPDAMLTELNARSHGKYFLCTCPQCQQHEAYIYKNNLNLIFCNRQNECGETTRVHYTEKNSTEALKENYRKKGTSKKWLTRQEKEELNVLTANMRYFTDELGSFDSDKGKNYRGISRGVYQNHLLITPDDRFGTRLLEAFPNLMRRYGRTEDSQKRFEHRDVVIPFYDERGQVDRLLLRSTSPDVTYTKEYPKELHCVVQSQKVQAKNFQHTLTLHEDTPILLTESILNALSVKEVDHDIEFIAATGVNHTRQMKDYVANHPEMFQDRGVILAFDPDHAGQKEQEKWKEFFQASKIPYSEFPYSDSNKDLNDLLREDRDSLQGTWKHVTKEFQKELDQNHEHYRELAKERLAQFIKEEYKWDMSSQSIQQEIEKEIQQGHPIGIAHTQFEKEDDTPACDVQVYVDFNQLELKQEITTDDQQIHQILEKNYDNTRTLSQDILNYNFQDLTEVNHQKIAKQAMLPKQNYFTLRDSNVYR